VHYQLARYYHRLSIFDKALFHYERAATLHQKNMYYLKDQGFLLQEMGQKKKAETLFRQALDSAPPEFKSALNQEIEKALQKR
jgi:tetratricopeptide (TPR) repeat protein